jgi:hypothetical protein
MISIDPMDTAGFYKLEGVVPDAVLLYGPNYVLSADYQLYRDQHETYTYPVDGWYWFDTQSDARTFFGLPPVPPDPVPPYLS